MFFLACDYEWICGIWGKDLPFVSVYTHVCTIGLELNWRRIKQVLWCNLINWYAGRSLLFGGFYMKPFITISFFLLPLLLFKNMLCLVKSLWIPCYLLCLRKFGLSLHFYDYGLCYRPGMLANLISHSGWVSKNIQSLLVNFVRDSCIKFWWLVLLGSSNFEFWILNFLVISLNWLCSTVSQYACVCTYAWNPIDWALGYISTHITSLFISGCY